MKIEGVIRTTANRNILVLCISILAATRIGPANAQTGQFNGTYAGVQTLEENGSVANYAECLKGPFKRRLVIKDGAATYVFNPTYQGTATGTVSPDGDVSAAAAEPSGGVSLSGKIQGDDFTGEVWSLYCTYSLQLKRVP
jgi:hypothetical protein